MTNTIDFRSDTVTQPSKQMKEVMFNAPLGDDVYGEDPSVLELEKYMAKLAQKEAALFVSSGTQSNLLALFAHCDRGEEYICGQDAHIYKYEAGGGAILASIQPQPIEFEKNASLCIKKIKSKIKPNDNHYAKTKLICLENTHHGQPLEMKYLEEISRFAKKEKLLLHLDGARVFNAVVHHNINLKDITKYFDSISICLSKGLGAPIGSVLIGNKEFIEKARRQRKMLGGGMRQAGILASAGLFALKNNIKDLKKDHELNKYITKELSNIKGIKIVSSHTNILFIKTKKEQALKEYLEKYHIKISGYGKLRIVLHRDISKNDARYLVEKIRRFFE